MKDLIKLYSFYSVSKTDGEKAICDYICSELDKLGVSYKRISNTIYNLSKDNKVLLSAHLDQVPTNGAATKFYKCGDNILAYNDRWQRTSLGADDKNGVWIILKLLQAGKKFDFIISECEEIGCLGIEKIENKLHNSSAEICLVLDRRGAKDILNGGSTCTYCAALATNLKNFFDDSFVVTTGSVSDTQTISKYIESVNMSVAYYNPHQATEYTDISALVSICKKVAKVVDGEFIHYPSRPSDYKKQAKTYDYKKYTKYNGGYGDLYY